MAEYLAWVVFVSLLAHLVVRRYVPAALLAAALGCATWMARAAASIGFDVKPGWTAPLFLLGFLTALPVALLCGLPFLARRNSRERRESSPNTRSRPHE